VPPALGVGLGADLVGRPSPEANQPATVVPGSQSGAMVFAQNVLIPQGIGSRLGPRGGYSSDGSPCVEFDVVAAAPTDRAMVADSVLHDLAHGGPLQLNESKLGRLGSAITRWFETQVAEGSSTESGVEDFWTRVQDAPHEAGLVPVGAKQSGITKPCLQIGGGHSDHPGHLSDVPLVERRVALARAKRGSDYLI
jgi:hypothetical protein